MTFIDLAKDAAVVIGVIAAAFGIYWGLTRNKRDTRNQALTESAALSDALKDQNSLLKEQIAELRSDKDAAENRWVEREKRFERRIADLEQDYRALVLTVTAMGLCANAATCRDYNPGDRAKVAAV